MTVKVRLLAVVLAAVTLAMPMASVASAAPPQKVDVIVVLDAGVDAREHGKDIARSHGARLQHLYGNVLNGFSAEVPEGRLQGLRRDARVDYVSPDGEVHALDYPTGVLRVDGDDAHSTASATGAGVRVAVIDTGVDLDHPDLAQNIDLENDIDCVNEDDSAQDDEGHGTHVAGTVAANGSVTGVAPAATIVPVKVLGADGSGSWSDIICGINHVAGLDGTVNEVDIANMSLGGRGSWDGLVCGTTNSAAFEAICEAVDAGIAFTVAAGNDGQDASKSVPASHPRVITVSAFSDDDGRADKTQCTGKGPWASCDEAFASFSNYGAIVDVIAPGVNIVSTTMDGLTGTASGTSMSAPHAAGVAALALEKYGDLTPTELLAHLQDTGQCPDHGMNAGTRYCEGQGSWYDDPDAPLTEPMVNAYWAATVVPGSGSGGGGTGTAPAAPTALSATAASSQIDLAWTDNSDNETGFDIERSVEGSAWEIVGSVDAGVTSYLDEGLGAGTTYDYRVVAWNSHGRSASDSVSATTLSEPSSGLTLDANGTKDKGQHVIELSWTGASSGVEIFRNGSSYTAASTEADGSGSYTDRTTNRGSATYEYWVCDDGGCSESVTVSY